MHDSAVVVSAMNKNNAKGFVLRNGGDESIKKEGVGGQLNHFLSHLIKMSSSLGHKERGGGGGRETAVILSEHTIN